MLPGALLVLPMSHRGATHRIGQIARRRKRRRRGIDATGQSRGHFLQQPAIAVRIVERCKRAIRAKLGIGAANANASKQVGLVRAKIAVARVVERLADRDAASEQLCA
jgi:hypothetical protein